MENKETNAPAITIINKDNKSLTGENAAAIPIKIEVSFKPLKYVAIGVLIAVVLIALTVFAIKSLVSNDNLLNNPNIENAVSK